jgi:hypothetical protein
VAVVFAARLLFARSKPTHPWLLGHLGKSAIETEKVTIARLDELTTLLEISTTVTSSLDTNTVLASILFQVEENLIIDKSPIIFYDKTK